VANRRQTMKSRHELDFVIYTFRQKFNKNIFADTFLSKSANINLVSFAILQILFKNLLKIVKYF
jgi:hypothetical protein